MATTSTHARNGSARFIILPILFAVLQILTPTLPLLGIGHPIGDQSDSVRTLVTPAGWAFSIWGALYAGALVFAIYQAMPKQRHNALLARIRLPAAGAFLGNALWAAYTQVYGLSALSVVIIVCTLVCLLAVYRAFSGFEGRFSRGERYCAVLPLSALASWLTVASAVNIAAALRFHGVEAGGTAPLIAAAVVLIAGGIAAAAPISGLGNPPYALVFLWALAAIYASGGQTAVVVAAATLIAALLVIGATIVGLRRGGWAHWFG